MSFLGALVFLQIPKKVIFSSRDVGEGLFLLFETLVNTEEVTFVVS